MIRALEEIDQDELRLFTSGIFRYQFSMVGRIDCSAHFQVANFWKNRQHPEFSILNRLCWSKNLHEERDAPTQILIGAMDSNFCVLLGLASWLEFSIAKYGISEEWFWNYHNLDDPDSIKNRADTQLKKVLNSPAFTGVESVYEGKKGTHSTRKFATTFARRSGCSKEFVDIRGRWKRKERGTQDSYADCTLPYPDAKVCAALCRGGPIHYAVKANSGISDDWILQYVVPNIAHEFDRAIALVLGRALLWRIFDPDESNVVPDFTRLRVTNAYRDLGERCQLDDGENPVQKLPLMVTGDDAEVIIDLIFDDYDDDGNGRNADGADMDGRRVRRRVQDEQVRYMNSQMLSLRRDNADLRTEFHRHNERQERTLGTINRNFRHLASNPMRMLGANRIIPEEDARAQREIENDIAVQEQEEEQRTASLSSCPKSIHTLWQEYEFGIGNRKPAKDFTGSERGRHKYSYHRRKVVWDQVAEMVRSGWDANTACTKIYEVYGANQAVTYIINQMRKDKMTGGHPSLKILQL